MNIWMRLYKLLQISHQFTKM